MRNVRVDTLGNGLRVISDSMDTVESVSVGVWIGAGTRYEEPAMNGVSHLLEHMVFKGTRRRDARAIAEEIEAVGGHLNAHTSREHTVFYAKALKDDLRLAIDIIADIVQNAVLPPEELDRERDVVVQEIMQSLDTPDDVIFDRFQAVAFPEQALGRSVLGVPERIREMPREAIVGYLRGHYGAGRMVLAAAGRVDHEALLELAAKAFETLPAGTDVPAEPGRYVGGDWRDDRPLEQVHLVMGFQGIPYRDPDLYAYSVLSSLLGGGMSSRLFQEAREKRGLVYSIYTFPESYMDSGVFGIYAGTGAKEVEELVPLICDQINDVTDSVSDAEVARARAQLKASILMSLESTSARCEQVARQLLVFGRPLSESEIVARIEAVDVAMVQNAARRLTESRLTVAALGPLGRLEPFERTTARFG